MLYQRPSGVTYVQMCIYIDTHIYKENKEEAEINLIHKYLYLLVFMLACKSRCFKNFDYYDEFALVAANKLLLRLLDERQFLPEGDPKKLDKIKSILNYIKLSLLGMRVDFQKENFACIIDPKVTEYFNNEKMKEDMRKSIQAERSMDLRAAISSDIQVIPQYLHEIINATPYATDKLMYQRLYISCLLTFLNMITLSNISKKYILEKQKKGKIIKDSYILKLYEKEQQNTICLWHLEKDMENYVLLIVNKLKKELIKNINETTSAYEISDDVLESILLADYVSEKRGVNIDED